MSAIKGFPSSFKITTLNTPRGEYATLQPTDDSRHSLDVISRSVNIFATGSSVEAGSTTNIIVSTAHGLIAGDMVRFKSPVDIDGAEEAVIEIIDANTFKLGGILRADPTGGTFDSGRYVTPSTDADGNISVSISGAGGMTVVDTIRRDYSAQNVTTGAYVTLVVTGAAASKVQIFDSSGETLELSLNAATRLMLITPGGNGVVDVVIPAASTVSIRAVSADATVGEIDINFIG